MLLTLHAGCVLVFFSYENCCEYSYIENPVVFFLFLFCCCFVWGFWGGKGEGKQRKGLEIILSRKTCLGIGLAVSSSVSVL